MDVDRGGDLDGRVTEEGHYLIDVAGIAVKERAAGVAVLVRREDREAEQFVFGGERLIEGREAGPFEMVRVH